ncbi:OB-fold domain-containing protein [Mycolicibacterium boenickei]|nr:OB-fold domain-containing protein [Mycolicibacterium boenickei]
MPRRSSRRSWESAGPPNSRHYFFPPERCVPGTDSANWQYVPSSGRGTVHTFSVVHRAPSPDFDAPYVLTFLDIEEGWSMLLCR